MTAPLRFTSIHWLLYLLVLALCGCVPGITRSDAEVAQAIAEPARLQLRLRQAGQFQLTTRERYNRPGDDLTVYLEGDGFAWVTRTQPSTDPTPDNPVALILAALDPSPNVAWIARPCQYTPRTANPACKTYYWTTGRLAPEVVASVTAAVSAAKADAGAKRIHLVGYSGGGGLAVLVAAGRDDVASIKTVAGTLDTDAFTTHHKVSPMTGSLNPASVARRVQHIPQLHLSGEKDTVVPARIARAYIAAMSSPQCSQLTVIPGATHAEGWSAVWPTHASTPLKTSTCDPK